MNTMKVEISMNEMQAVTGGEVVIPVDIVRPDPKPFPQPPKPVPNPGFGPLDEVVYRNGIFTHDEVMRMLNA